MTSEPLRPAARTVVAQAQALTEPMQYACTLAEGSTWMAYITMLSGIQGDITRLLELASLVPGSYVLPQRGTSS